MECFAAFMMAPVRRVYDSSTDTMFTGMVGMDRSVAAMNIHLPEISLSLLDASNDWELKTNVYYRRTVLAVGKIIQDCARGWLGMTTND